MSAEEIDYPVVPYLIVHDAHAAIDFYKAAFGAYGDIWPTEDGKRVAHASLHINGGLIYLCDEFDENDADGLKSPTTLGGSSSFVVLGVKDADAWFDRAVSAGAVVVRPLTDEFYGRNGKLRDPFGHFWGILGTTG